MKLYELPARPQPTVAFAGDARCKGYRQGGKRNGRHYVVHAFDAHLFKVLSHVFRRIVDDGEARIVEGSMDFFYKNAVDLKKQQPGTGPHSFEQEVGDHAVAGAKFDDYIGMIGVNFRYHGAA